MEPLQCRKVEEVGEYWAEYKSGGKAEFATPAPPRRQLAKGKRVTLLVPYSGWFSLRCMPRLYPA
jgi:hypothetical protein